MPPGLAEVIEFVNKADTPVILVVILYALYREWIVFGKDHKREVESWKERCDKAEKRADTWQAQALRSTNLAEWAKQLLETGPGTNTGTGTGKAP